MPNALYHLNRFMQLIITALVLPDKVQQLAGGRLTNSPHSNIIILKTSKQEPKKNFKTFLPIALLPPYPVIIAFARHQHYNSSDRCVIIPQSTSKRQHSFQGKIKTHGLCIRGDWFNLPEQLEAQMEWDPQKKLDKGDLCCCNFSVKHWGSSGESCFHQTVFSH